MELKRTLMVIGIVAPLLGLAQPAVMNSNASGFFQRGQLMYGDRNYVGAIDQLTHMGTLPTDGEQDELAAFTTALAMFERGEQGSLDALQAFIDEYPLSPLATQAQLKIGNYYFYRNEWENALLSFSLVRRHALDDDADENLLYRMAYCNLRLANYDAASVQYSELARTRRYAEASLFYQAYTAYATGDKAEARKLFAALDPDTELGEQSQYYLVQMLFSDKQYDQVISRGRQLLALNANDYFDAELNRVVGESYYQQGNDTQAGNYIKNYLDNPEGDVQRTAAYIMGVLDMRQANYDNVVNNMSMVVGESDALAQSAYLYMGQARIKTGDLNGAARAFEQAASMNYDRDVKETACYNYAVSQAQGARTPFDKSIDNFEQFLNDFPQSRYRDSVEGYLVDAYMNTSDYERALTSINHIKHPGTRVKQAKQHVLYNLGVQALANNQNNEAEAYLKQAVALGDVDKTTLNESRLWLAEAQYRNGDYANAAANQRAYVKAADKSDENYALAQYNLGYTLYQQRQYDEARKAFQNALSTNKLPSGLKADAYSRVGDTHYYGQDYNAAQKSYDQAIDAADANAKDYAMYQKGLMLGLSKQYGEEVKQMDALLKAYPNSQYAPQAMLEKGNALASSGNGQAAVAAYNTLLKAYPKSTEARIGLLQMAIVDKNMNNEDAAIEAYKQVIKRYPSSNEAQAAAEDMKLIYADRGKLTEFAQFLNSVPGGPRLDVNEVDRLTFEAAEKAAIADKPSIDRMQQYLANYPDGAYAPRARYYIARHDYNAGKYNTALVELDRALAGNTDASFAEDALAMRSDILLRQGRYTEAIHAYSDLIERSSSADNRVTAQLGLMRAAEASKQWNLVKSTADDLLASEGLNADEENRVTLARAKACKALGDTKGAMADFKTLAADPKSESGAQASYELARMQFEQGDLKGAEKTANALIDAGTPHNYWLAKQFILLSDIYAKQGKTADARDYLQSLKNNYPGNEQDIFEAINSRLASLSGNKGGATASASSDNSKKSKSKK